ncbi:hypothetical protein PIROE2DRAFT_15781 [Piromyces sp. E2]|nr:hypothetical protein PIROE2DRAFT_15781 [Piromyces sp. E2]|eukprot:OUM58852.1 hypothetical protein PIROE2DRAFT_15781 [Piromyces sp. E2]
MDTQLSESTKEINIDNKATTYNEKIIYTALAASSFIGDVKRAELFEITDNEVSVIRINIPEEDFTSLKEVANKGYHMYLPDGKSITFDRDDEDENTQFFDKHDPSFWRYLESFDGFDPYKQLTFETKNGTMTFEINGTVEKYDKITLKLGGSSSRKYAKSGYNIKIRGKQDLHGLTQIKIRPDARKATFLRKKLASDILKRLGLPTVSANYVTLYINNEYMGLYLLLDAIKKSWIKSVYDEEKTTSLYECTNVNNDLSVKGSLKKCNNDNEEITDKTELLELLTAFDNAKSAEDLENIFDIDLFLTEMAYEFLSGSWDHYLLYGHNFFLYKPKDDKWKMILNDFDGDFGQDVKTGALGLSFRSLPTNSTDYPSFTFSEWAHSPRHLVDILIFKDSTRFDNILKKFVIDVFNPATLFPHIDELKKFIKPYVELDKIPNENGKYPGRNNEGIDDYTLAQWDANCEFTTIKTEGDTAYGLKYWILAKYRSICKNYNMDCDPVYMDENYKYTVDKSVEPLPEDNELGDLGTTQPTETTIIESKPTESSTVESQPVEVSSDDESQLVEVSEDEPQQVEISDDEPLLNDDSDDELQSTKSTKINKIKTKTVVIKKTKTIKINKQ